MNYAASIGLLIFVTSGVYTSAASGDTRNDGFLVTTETFLARDGVLEMRLNTAAIQRVGLTLLGDAAFVAAEDGSFYTHGGVDYEVDAVFLSSSMVTVAHCLLDAPTTPWIEHEDRRIRPASLASPERRSLVDSCRHVSA